MAVLRASCSLLVLAARLGQRQVFFVCLFCLIRIKPKPASFSVMSLDVGTCGLSWESSQTPMKGSSNSLLMFWLANVQLPRSSWFMVFFVLFFKWIIYCIRSWRKWFNLPLSPFLAVCFASFLSRQTNYLSHFLWCSGLELLWLLWRCCRRVLIPLKKNKSHF